MEFSLHTTPFFLVPPPLNYQIGLFFLSYAKNNFSSFDFVLFKHILSEWESCCLLLSCFTLWKKYVRTNMSSFFSSLHCLPFNVHGFNHRWNEVFLLANSFKLDIIVLVETGVIDLSWMNKLFPDRSIYYQKDENSFGGIAVLIRKDLKTKKLDCNLPNICTIDIELEEKIRIVGVNAPESKTWNWKDLMPFISSKCVLLGDFNVDLDKDTKPREILLKWADSCSLCPSLPNSFTSLRSNSYRTIDYALSSGIPVSIQTYKGGTTSDHKPILSVVSCSRNESVTRKNVHWQVFS